MKRVAILLALVAAAVVGVDVLGDLTQSRPDAVHEGEVTELVLSIEHDRFVQGDDAAANALWAVCAGQTGSRATEPLARIDGGLYRIVLSPAVGEHESRKLRGCLHDLTVDRVSGSIESWRTMPVGHLATEHAAPSQ